MLSLMEVYSMIDPTPLSPAAQAVWDAFDQDAQEIEAVAAVLRAAADQVAPKFWHENNDIYGETIQDVRDQLLAIADELEKP